MDRLEARANQAVILRQRMVSVAAVLQERDGIDAETVMQEAVGDA